MELVRSRCPGCGLELPREARPYAGYYHASPECWSIYTEVLAEEYSNAVLFGQVHQLSVDAYAVQHAGGAHPDKSVCVHLVGLHLVLEKHFQPPRVPALLQKLATAQCTWPHFDPPAEHGSSSVFDVAMARSPVEHAARVREWAARTWDAWREHHAAAAELAQRVI